MDVVFLGYLALLWAAFAALIVGLDRLAPGKGERP
jgi:hypothetical protein